MLVSRNHLVELTCSVMRGHHVGDYEKLFLYFPLVCPLSRFLGDPLNPRDHIPIKEANRWSFSPLGFYSPDIFEIQKKLGQRMICVV